LAYAAGGSTQSAQIPNCVLDPRQIEHDPLGVASGPSVSRLSRLPHNGRKWRSSTTDHMTQVIHRCFLLQAERRSGNCRFQPPDRTHSDTAAETTSAELCIVPHWLISALGLLPAVMANDKIPRGESLRGRTIRHVGQSCGTSKSTVPRIAPWSAAEARSDHEPAEKRVFAPLRYLGVRRT
jgi:hypothetical protein